MIFATTMKRMFRRLVYCLLQWTTKNGYLIGEFFYRFPLIMRGHELTHHCDISLFQVLLGVKNRLKRENTL